MKIPAWYWAAYDWEPHQVLAAFNNEMAAREFIPAEVEKEIRAEFPYCALYLDELEVLPSGQLKAALLTHAPHPPERWVHLGRNHQSQEDRYLGFVDTIAATPHEGVVHDGSDDASHSHLPPTVPLHLKTE